MLSRSGSGVSAQDPAERMMGLLARAEGGWVPPAQQDDGVDAPGVDQPGVDQPGVDAPGVDAPGDRSATGGYPSGGLPSLPARSWDAAPDAPARGLAGLLPASIRSGRFDPGRRGVVGLVVVALFAAVVTGGVLLRGQPQEVTVPALVVPAVVGSGTALPGTSPSPVAELVVAVAGKVRRPGLVRLPVGSRVDDAVQAAGGPEPGVSLDLLNLARKLVDGEQVLVGVDPPPGAAAGPPGAAAGPAAPAGLLDLNAATVSDLDSLPGIGPVLAQRIVDWRTENGRFGSIEQLREVTGIGAAKYDDLQAKVTV
ncbi:MAG: helix-hairpin-helix domain-containing protein [Mycobacteriales bacterium]